MIQVNFNELPQLPQSDRRPVTRVSIDQIKTTGVVFATFGMQVGDVIEFPAYDDKLVVVSQPVRQGSTAMQYLVGVNRNGKPDYLSLGVLTRSDINRVPSCDFTKQMVEMNNNEERLQFLAGKKITCKETKTIKTQAFDQTTGIRLDGQTRDTVAPIITYVQ